VLLFVTVSDNKSGKLMRYTLVFCDICWHQQRPSSAGSTMVKTTMVPAILLWLTSTNSVQHWQHSTAQLW